ncbi:plastid developmental protein DAG, partial [Striga asiatica]
VLSRPAFVLRLRPLIASASAFHRLTLAISTRGFATRQRTSSLNDQNPNGSNRPPNKTSILEGCDFKHWLVVMEPPDENAMRDKIIDSYIKTLAMIFGSEEEARMKIYSVSTKCYFAFGARVGSAFSQNKRSRSPYYFLGLSISSAKMASRYLARRALLSTTRPPFSIVSHSYTTAAVASSSSGVPSRPAAFVLRLRPLVASASASASYFRRHTPAISTRGFVTQQGTSSLNDQNPNCSNLPPKETNCPDGCDFEHWLVVMEPPDANATREEIINWYIETLAMVLGSKEEARMKIYSVSTRCYFAFGALVPEEISYKIKELPRVRWVLPDSYLDEKNKDYGGEPFINGQAVPYDPKYHAEWMRNNSRANKRNMRNDEKKKTPQIISKTLPAVKTKKVVDDNNKDKQAVVDAQVADDKNKKAASLNKKRPHTSTSKKDTPLDYESRGNKKIRVDEDNKVVLPPRSIATAAKGSTIVSYLANVLPHADTCRWGSDRKKRANDVARGLGQELARRKKESDLLSQHNRQLTTNNLELNKKVAALNGQNELLVARNKELEQKLVEQSARHNDNLKVAAQNACETILQADISQATPSLAAIELRQWLPQPLALSTAAII